MSQKKGQNGLSSLLGMGVECEGTSRVDGSLRLDGTYRGRLEVGDTLVIGHTGAFSGQAYAREIVIAGGFEGEALGTERVELQKGARMKGDILTRSFVVEPGVWFEGHCRMELTQADEDRLRIPPLATAPGLEERDPKVRPLAN